MRDDKKLIHLDHAEDAIIRSGAEGFRLVTDTLSKTHDFLNGKRPPGFEVSEKFDGSPAIITGHHPETGEFFISTKSLFNKVPKINYTAEDIDKNFPNSPGLRKKLQQALLYLPSSLPKRGVFQGDMMYTAEDVGENGDRINFTPNTLTYTASKQTPEGRRILNTKLGIVIHTEYKGQDVGKLRATFPVDQTRFKNTGDVNFIDPAIDQNHIKYTPEQEKEYAVSMLKAAELNKSLKASGVYDKIQGQEPLLMPYINDAVKAGKERNLTGYLKFIEKRYKKRIEGLKMDKNKVARKEDMDKLIAYIMDNKEGIDDLFALHKLLADAKDNFVKILSEAKPKFKYSILGSESKPEGFVVVNNGIPFKLVDRHAFSMANFDWNEKIDPSDQPMVFSFGRMNPPTIGHDKLVNKVIDVARRMGAEHRIIMTNTQDPDKNPLTPAQKLVYAKQAFPDTNVTVAGQGNETIINQCRDMYKKGVRHLTLIAGEDRVNDFAKLLNRYNGKPEFFNFRKIRVVSAGHRDPESEGVEGMSASKVRAAAKKGDYETFKTGMPSHFKEPDTQSMFKDIRTAMGEKHKERQAKIKADIDIGPKTKGIALSIYSKRDISDRIGSKARQEINRRRREGVWTGK